MGDEKFSEIKSPACFAEQYNVVKEKINLDLAQVINTLDKVI